MAFRRSASMSDLERYRAGYPGQRDARPRISENLRFYRNEIPSQPSGDFIEKILSEWFGDYDRLEEHHGYVQWLFPLREAGVNSLAQELQLHEARTIRSDPLLVDRALRCYVLMLDFYGFRMIDRKTGALVPSENAVERWANMCRFTHNFLRVTRILKFLGEIGLQAQYGYPFLHGLIVAATTGDKPLASVFTALCGYWIETVKESPVRQEMSDFAQRAFRSGVVGRLPRYAALFPTSMGSAVPRAPSAKEAKDMPDDEHEATSPHCPPNPSPRRRLRAVSSVSRAAAPAEAVCAVRGASSVSRNLSDAPPAVAQRVKGPWVAVDGDGAAPRENPSARTAAGRRRRDAEAPPKKRDAGSASGSSSRKRRRDPDGEQ